MKRINVMVSDEAKEKILAYKKQRQYTTLDETVDTFILFDGCAEQCKSV